jgi:caffeoyl-CoA O-methyltransferase
LEIVNPKAQEYAERFSTPEDELLKSITDGFRNHPEAHMMSGHLQGKFLEIFSTIIQPLRILEVGTFTGYSALCLVKGLKSGGKLHTIENREDIASIAQENFNRSNEPDKIILHIGNALEIIPTLNETWDLVFIDADKTNYLQYYKLISPAVRKDGVILADNVLFHGEVLEQPVTGKNAKAIHSFNEYINLDQSVEKLILTIRDGLFIVRKK